MLVLLISCLSVCKHLEKLTCLLIQKKETFTETFRQFDLRDLNPNCCSATDNVNDGTRQQ